MKINHSLHKILKAKNLLLKLKIKPKDKNLLLKNKRLPQGLPIKNKSHPIKPHHKQALQDPVQGNKQALKLKLKNKLKMLVHLTLPHNNHKSSASTGFLLIQVISSLGVFPKG